MRKMIYSILSAKSDKEKLNALVAGMKGISGADLQQLSFDEITAIVSDMNEVGLVADQSTAIEYAGVIETLSQQFTLLPMRFGSLLESTDAVIKMLERNYTGIQQNLEKVENKYEFGLKIFCEPEKLMAELRAKSESEIETPSIPGPEIKFSVYRDWVNKKLKEHRLEELLVTYIDSVIAEISGQLCQLKAISKFKKMATATTIIDAVLFLEKEQKDSLVRAVRDIQNQYPELNFILTGPWPPYNFVEITIK